MRPSLDRIFFDYKIPLAINHKTSCRYFPVKSSSTVIHGRSFSLRCVTLAVDPTFQTHVYLIGYKNKFLVFLLNQMSAGWKAGDPKWLTKQAKSEF